MQKMMNKKNKTHKCVPRNSQINLYAKSMNNLIFNTKFIFILKNDFRKGS